MRAEEGREPVLHFSVSTQYSNVSVIDGKTGEWTKILYQYPLYISIE